MTKIDLSQNFNSAPEREFKISELFSGSVPENGPGGDSFSITERQFMSSGAKFRINPVIRRIAADLMLTFVAEKEIHNNVCLANHEEFRPEFRLTFSPMDILDYILGNRQCRGDNGDIKQPNGDIQIPYPKDPVDFWKAVDLGRSIRLGR